MIHYKKLFRLDITIFLLVLILCFIIKYKKSNFSNFTTLFFKKIGQKCNENSECESDICYLNICSKKSKLEISKNKIIYQLKKLVKNEIKKIDKIACSPNCKLNSLCLSNLDCQDKLVCENNYCKS